MRSTPPSVSSYLMVYFIFYFIRIYREPSQLSMLGTDVGLAGAQWTTEEVGRPSSQGEIVYF